MGARGTTRKKEHTPVMRQFLAAKAQHPDAIVRVKVRGRPPGGSLPTVSAETLREAHGMPAPNTHPAIYRATLSALVARAEPEIVLFEETPHGRTGLAGFGRTHRLGRRFFQL